jgi:hypothetical protein
MTAPSTLTVAFMTGTKVRLECSFRRPPTEAEVTDGTACNADDWQPIDPDTVTAKVGKVVNGTMDEGTISEHVYLLTPPPDDIQRDDVGEYHLNITAGTPNEGGKEHNYWSYRWESFGNGQAVVEGMFRVLPSKFPPA